MKTFILALALLFSSATMAQTLPEGVTLEDFPVFLDNNIEIGLESDVVIYREYVNLTFKYGSPINNIKVAIKYAQCSLTWRKVLELGVETEKLGSTFLRHAIWRAILSTKLHVTQSGGDSLRVESFMVPTLAQEAEMAMTASHIQSCAALDLVMFYDLIGQGIQPSPPESWTLEPVPVIKIDPITPGFAS